MSSAVVRLRLATPDDAADVAAIYAPYTETSISFELEAPGVEEMRARIERILDRHAWVVAEEIRPVGGSRLVGYAYAGAHRERAAYRWSVDTSVYVDHTRLGAGIGRAVMSGLLRILVRQGYWNAFAGMTLPNPASAALHRGLGYVPVGVYRRVGHKAGAWYDVAWFHRRLVQGGGRPGPLRRLDELEPEEVEEALGRG